jgi:hypothetical protein
MGGDDILADLKSRTNLPYSIEEAPCLGACGRGAMVAIDFENGTSILVTGMEETLSELGLSSSSSSSSSKTTALDHPLETSMPKTSTNLIDKDDSFITTAITTAPPTTLLLSNREEDEKNLTKQQHTLQNKATIWPPTPQNTKIMDAVVLVKFSETASSTPAATAICLDLKPNLPHEQPPPQQPQHPQQPPIVDARDRMRAQAKQQREQREQVSNNNNNNPWLNAASYLAGKAAEKLFGNRKNQ